MSSNDKNGKIGLRSIAYKIHGYHDNMHIVDVGKQMFWLISIVLNRLHLERGVN